MGFSTLYAMALDRDISNSHSPWFWDVRQDTVTGGFGKRDSVSVMNKRNKERPDKKDISSTDSTGNTNKSTNSNKQKRSKEKRRRWVPRVVYLLFLVAAVIYVSNRGGAFSYALFYTLLLYPPLAFLYLLYVRATVRIYQETPLREVRKGTEETYRLTIVNAGWLPTSGIVLTRETGTVFREDMTGQVLSFLPREKKEFHTRIRCLFAGSYIAGIERIRFHDCFGLMSLSLRNPNPLRLQVLPAVTGMAGEDMNRVIWEMVHGAPGRQRESENTLGVDLAKYTPGDPLKRIHWKNYARSGALYVRQLEEREFDMLAVALIAIPGVAEENEEERLSRRDHFIEYAVSIAGILAEQRQPVQFLFYNSDVKRVLVEDLEGMQSLCRELSKEIILRDRAESIEKKVREAARRSDAVALCIKEGEEKLCLM